MLQTVHRPMKYTAWTFKAKAICLSHHALQMKMMIMNDKKPKLSLTFTSHIDCTIDNFKRSNLFNINLDTIGIPQTHLSERQINIPCKIGYTGFLKIACSSNGQWRKVIRGACERKFILVFKNFEYIFYDAILQIGNIFTQIFIVQRWILMSSNFFIDGCPLLVYLLLFKMHLFQSSCAATPESPTMQTSSWNLAQILCLGL